MDINEKILKEVDQLLLSDDEYKKLNNQILMIEEQIKSALEYNTKLLFLKYEAMVIRQNTLANLLIYKKLGTY